MDSHCMRFEPAAMAVYPGLANAKLTKFLRMAKTLRGDLGKYPEASSLLVFFNYAVRIYLDFR